MIEYNWTIPNVEREADTGFVTVVHWRVTAQDGEYTASSYGTVGFTPDREAEGFVPFDQLTEAQVLEWVYASVDKAEMEANLAGQIEEQKAPKTVSGTPWG